MRSALLLLALAALPAFAERGDREKEIVVGADRLTADDANRTSTFDGNVVVTQGTMRMTAGKVVVKDMGGTRVACCAVAGGDCRGNQSGTAPRFVLAPGTYKFELVGPDGKATVKDVTVANSPMQVKVN